MHAVFVSVFYPIFAYCITHCVHFLTLRTVSRTAHNQYYCIQYYVLYTENFVDGAGAAIFALYRENRFTKKFLRFSHFKEIFSFSKNKKARFSHFIAKSAFTLYIRFGRRLPHPLYSSSSSSNSASQSFFGIAVGGIGFRSKASLSTAAVKWPCSFSLK